MESPLPDTMMQYRGPCIWRPAEVTNDYSRQTTPRRMAAHGMFEAGGYDNVHPSKRLSRGEVVGESLVLSILSCPNILTSKDVGTSDGLPFMGVEARCSMVRGERPKAITTPP